MSVDEGNIVKSHCVVEEQICTNQVLFAPIIKKSLRISIPGDTNCSAFVRMWNFNQKCDSKSFIFGNEVENVLFPNACISIWLKVLDEESMWLDSSLLRTTWILSIENENNCCEIFFDKWKSKLNFSLVEKRMPFSLPDIDGAASCERMRDEIHSFGLFTPPSRGTRSNEIVLQTPSISGWKVMRWTNLRR